MNILYIKIIENFLSLISPIIFRVQGLSGRKDCMCIYRKAYIQKTEILRHTDDSSFFISFVPPHKKITSQSLAGCVMDMFQKGGINMTNLTAHSVRSAATSSGFQKSLSSNKISKAVW